MPAVFSEPQSIQVAGTLRNDGTSTVYYRDEYPVSTTLNDGSLGQGQSVSLSGVQWIACAAGQRSNVTVIPSAVSSGGGGGTTVTIDGVEVTSLNVNTDVTPADIGAAAASDLTDHTGDTSGAHAASAISFSPTGSVSSTDVQAAIAEVASEASGGGASLNGFWLPTDNGYKGWSYDISEAVNGSALGAGTLYVARVPIMSSGTLTKACVGISSAGATLTAGQNFALIFNSSGTLIGRGAAEADWVGSAPYIAQTTVTAESGQSLAVTAGGWVHVGVYSQGTTRPTLSRSVSGNALVNVGLTAATYRSGSFAGAYTTSPPTSLPTLVQGQPFFWAAVI